MLEPRILPTDYATLGTNQSSVEIDVLVNDSTTWEAGYLQISKHSWSGANGFLSPNSAGDKLVYSIGDVGSLGEKDGVVTEVGALITAWENQMVDDVDKGYDVALAALGRLRTFVTDNSATNSWLAGAIGTAVGTGGSIIGSGATQVAGLIFAVGASWAANNQGASNVDLLDAMQAGLVAKKSVEINAVRAEANAARAAFATFQSGLGNLPTLSEEYLGYTVDDGMDDAVGLIVIDLSNRPYYRGIIDSLEGYKESIRPAMETFPSYESSITNVYGELLKELGQRIGGELHLYQATEWYQIVVIPEVLVYNVYGWHAY